MIVVGFDDPALRPGMEGEIFGSDGKQPFPCAEHLSLPGMQPLAFLFILPEKFAAVEVPGIFPFQRIFVVRIIVQLRNLVPGV